MSFSPFPLIAVTKEISPSDHIESLNWTQSRFLLPPGVDNTKTTTRGKTAPNHSLLALRLGLATVSVQCEPEEENEVAEVESDGHSTVHVGVTTLIAIVLSVDAVEVHTEPDQHLQ